jgi:long-chain fatty acid transport protein
MKNPKIPLIALLAGLPSGLNANGFRLVSQDAFAASRAEAFAATADNPSAIHYNPAGISQLEGHQIRLGAYALQFEPTFRPPADAANAGTTYEIEKQEALAPQFYYSYGIPESPVTLGLGVYAPHGASVTWPQDTGFRAVATDGELTYLRVNPVISLEIRPGLSFAIGAMVDDATISLGQGLLPTVSPFRNSFRFEGDAGTTGYNMGLLWKATDKLSFGVTYRSKMSLDFSGQTNLEQEPLIRPTEIPAKMELEFPYTVVFGVSYRPTERWNIEANADFSNWSTIDSTLIRQSETPPFPVQEDIPVTLEWKDSWILKLGVTRYFDEGWYASAGYLFNENSVPSGYYTPVVADLDRHFFTLGLGRKWSRFNVDLAYQLGFAPDRIVTGSASPSSPATFVGQDGDGFYDFASHGVLFSVGMKF